MEREAGRDEQQNKQEFKNLLKSETACLVSKPQICCSDIVTDLSTTEPWVARGYVSPLEFGGSAEDVSDVTVFIGLK